MESESGKDGGHDFEADKLFTCVFGSFCLRQIDDIWLKSRSDEIDPDVLANKDAARC